MILDRRVVVNESLACAETLKSTMFGYAQSTWCRHVVRSVGRLPDQARRGSLDLASKTIHLVAEHGFRHLATIEHHLVNLLVVKTWSVTRRHLLSRRESKARVLKHEDVLVVHTRVLNRLTSGVVERYR
jgi:hypothetical protein